MQVGQNFWWLSSKLPLCDAGFFQKMDVHINRRMGKYNIVRSYFGIIHSEENEQTIYNSIDESYEQC